MQACKVDLPLLPKRGRPSPSVAVSSVLFEPSSRSLALMLSDSSVLLYPPPLIPIPFLSPPPSLSLSSTPTSIPPISTSACFLRLLPTTPTANPGGHVLFLTASPHAGSSSVLLRAWILRNDLFFTPARFNFKRERDKLGGIAVGLRHGFSVEIAGSVNVFVLHSPVAGQVWVLAAAKLAGETVEVMKCAVIECTSPIYSVRVSQGFLLLGEVGGVRVFPLRPLVKGQARNQKHLGRRIITESLSLSSNIELRKGGQKKKLPNGVVVIGAVNGGNGAFHASGLCSGTLGCCCDCKGDGLMERNVNSASSDCCCDEKADCKFDSTKLRTLKLRQNSSDFNSNFVAIKCAEEENPKSIRGASSSSSVKAISIHVLSHRRFLILDSIGNLHLLSLCNTVLTSEATISSLLPSKDVYIMRHLDYPMKVQRLAVLPDVSLRTQVVWISDAFHSVHIISVADIVENDKDKSDGKLMQISANQAIFTSEKIRDIVPLAATAVLILGQGNIYAYAIA